MTGASEEIEPSSATPVRPTIFDVAHRAGVSKSTVSKVLTQAPHVGVDTRRRVEAAIADLRYRPNVAARRFQSRRSRLIGLIARAGGESPAVPTFVSAFLPGAGAAAARHGYDLVWLVSISRGGDQGEEYARRYLQREVDGLILLNMRLDDPRVLILKESGCPFVVVGAYDHPAVYTVDVDNVAVGYLASRHLLDLGHRHIGLLNGTPDLPFCRDRHAGYVHALVERGLAPETAPVVWQPLREPEGYAGTLELLRSAPDLTALVITDPALRAGCLRALHERDLAVPGRVSLVGVDDFMPDGEQPPITVVVQPTAALAAVAVETVLRLIEGDQPEPVHVQLAPRLVIGQSTAAPR